MMSEQTIKMEVPESLVVAVRELIRFREKDGYGWVKIHFTNHEITQHGIEVLKRKKSQ